MVSGSCAKIRSRAQLFRVPLTFECKWFSGAATVTPNVVDWDEGKGRLVQIASKMMDDNVDRCVKRQRKGNKLFTVVIK